MVTVRVRNGISVHPLLVPNKIKHLLTPGDLTATVSNTIMLRPGGVYKVRKEIQEWLNSMVSDWLI